MHPYGLSAPHGGPQRTRALQTTQRRHSGRRLNLATTTTQYTTARDAESTANSGITAPERASYRNPAPDNAPTARRHEARSLINGSAASTRACGTAAACRLAPCDAPGTASARRSALPVSVESSAIRGGPGKATTDVAVFESIAGKRRCRWHDGSGCSGAPRWDVCGRADRRAHPVIAP